MSDMKEKEKARQTRTERELEKLGEGMSGESRPKAPAKPKTEPPKEKSGVGRDHSQSNFERLVKDLEARIAAAEKAGNVDLANKYKANLARLKEAQ